VTLVIAISLVCIAICAAQIPSDWQAQVQEGHFLFVQDEPTDVNHMPFVGNGYVATTINSDTMYCSVSGFCSSLTWPLRLGTLLVCLTARAPPDRVIEPAFLRRFESQFEMGRL
jgi:hypothetical protein